MVVEREKKIKGASDREDHKSEKKKHAFYPRPKSLKARAT